MRSVIALAGAISSFLASSALADTAPGPYIDTFATAGLAPDLGLVRPATEELRPDDLSNGIYGYAFANGFKAEVERLGFGSAIPGISSTPVGGVRRTTVMLNGMYEFSNGSWRLKPYIGIGVGMTDFSTRLLGNVESSFLPAYQVKGGVNYNITQKLLGYALGREAKAWTVHGDELPAVRAVVREAAAHDFRWSAIVSGIVKSAPFQTRID